MMKITRMVLLLLLACNGVDHEGTDGESGPPGQKGDPGQKGEMGLPGSAVIHDGSRIQARYITTQDGYKMEYGLWDKQRNEACQWVKVDDQIKCLPSFVSVSVTGAPSEFGFLDSDCKTAVYLPNKGQAPDLNACPFNGPTRYAFVNYGAAPAPFCAIPLWASWLFPQLSTKTGNLFTLGPIQTISGTPPTFYFFIPPSTCQSFPVTPTFYYPLTAVNFLEFAEGKISNP